MGSCQEEWVSPAILGMEYPVENFGFRRKKERKDSSVFLLL